MKSIISNAYSRAEVIIKDHSDSLIRVAEALLERESLDGAEVRILMDNGTLPPVPPSGGTPAPTQQVIRPESGSGRRITLEGETPATA